MSMNMFIYKLFVYVSMFKIHLNIDNRMISTKVSHNSLIMKELIWLHQKLILSVNEMILMKFIL